ncbi:hypothetical protein QJQ45_006411 [Haematococcus lacustris]|nr:hypothetical protein QJQ45_006411 [Haematococcus lacustris]
MESRGPEVVEIVTPKDSGTAATPEEVEGLASGKFIKAVKAICIARQYLKSDDLDLSFQPAFRGKERRANVALYIAKSAGPRAPLLPEGEVVDLQVSSRSRPVQVAGALAARVREGANVSLVAIGVDAVSNAVLTIGNTRLYLEQNNLDIRAAPEFITVQKEERALNASYSCVNMSTTNEHKCKPKRQRADTTPDGPAAAAAAAELPFQRIAKCWNDDVLPQLAANMLVRSVIRGSPAPVYCIGAPSIYKAVRIVCEAAKNFEDKLLAVKPEFRDNEQRGSALVLRVHDEPKSSISASEEPETVMQVASRSIAVQIAASQTRDGKRNINLQAAGAQAVGSAVLAVAFARLFLSNDGLDVKAIPSWQTKAIKQEKEGDPETLKVGGHAARCALCVKTTPAGLAGWVEIHVEGEAASYHSGQSVLAIGQVTTQMAEIIKACDKLVPALIPSAHRTCAEAAAAALAVGKRLQGQEQPMPSLCSTPTQAPAQPGPAHAPCPHHLPDYHPSQSQLQGLLHLPGLSILTRPATNPLTSPAEEQQPIIHSTEEQDEQTMPPSMPKQQQDLATARAIAAEVLQQIQQVPALLRLLRLQPDSKVTLQLSTLQDAEAQLGRLEFALQHIMQPK